MEKKYLNTSFEIEEIFEKKEDSQNFGIIKGLASTFGNVDQGQDRVIKGAFARTLEKYNSKNRQIRMFYQHDYKNVIGGFSVFKENRKGLLVEGKINLEVQKGREAYSLAKQGVMNDFSIGYFVKDSEWVSEKVGEKDGNDVTMDIRNLKEIDLSEISLVSNPMNEEAIVTSIKSCETITDITRFLKSFGISNKETNDIIYFIKKLPRNEDNKSANARNEVLSKIDKIKLINSFDEVINRIKKDI